MKRKFTLLVVPLFVLLLIGVTRADWTLKNQTGQWDICSITRTAFKGWADGNVTWQTSIDDFQGFTVELNVSEWDVWREWWQYGTIQDYYVHILVSDGETTVGAVLKIHGWTGLFGMFEGSAYYGYATLTDNFATLDSKLNTKEAWLYTTAEVKYASIVVSKDGEIWFFVKDLNNTYSGSYSLGYNLDENVTITLNYYHGGQGAFDITKTLSYTVKIPPGHIPYPQGKSWWEAVWNNIQGFFAGIAGWADFIYNGLVFFWNLIVVPIATNIPTILAILPIIIIFWFLDAIVTSIQEGDLHPLGNVIMTIIDFLRSVIQTIVNIAETIWTIIEFW